MNKSILVSLCTIAISQILALGAAMAQDADRLKAAEKLQDENIDKSLEDKMKAAGIGQSQDSAASILERLKNK